MLKLEHISKTYPGVVALDDVSLEFEQGEVHALLGENGAGKSTLIKIIAGAIEPDAGGVIDFDGKKFTHMTPALSAQNGVAVIYQDINLVTPMTVAENIFMGRKMGKVYSKRRLNALARELFAEYGFNMDPSMKVSRLSPANQQLVEIARAISNNAKIMIMDEPTAPLAAHEVELLFSIIRKLKERGVTVVYISPRMDEVFQITERISVLRDGRLIKTLDTADTDRRELVSLMVGRELNESFPARTQKAGEVVLEARDLTGNSVEHISFQLHRGEILGFAGLVGSGRSETMELISGAKRPDSGEILINGRKVSIGSPASAIRHGIGLIPEDRKEQGVILHNTVQFNISLSSMKKLTRLGFISGRRNSALAEKYRGELRIKVPGVKQMVVNLSGGNQQKVALAKALAADPDIIIFDEPTKGIDVGAKQEIYQLMNDLVESGKAIIMVLLETTLPFWVVWPVCIVLGFLMGTLNGLIASKLKLFPLVVTIATSEVFKGIAYTITSSKSYSGMPDAFRALYKTKLLGLPLDVYLAILVVAATWIVLNKTHFGRDVLAVGGNKECARLSGIRSDLVQTLCFALTGAIFAIATLDMLAQQNQTSATTGPGTEITCLTAAIIGGISMMGGKGNVVVIVAGIFVMQMIANGMQLAGWGTYTQYIVKGVILLLAIGFDAIKNYPKPVVRIHKDKVGAGKAS